MPRKVNIYVELSDLALKEQVLHKLTEDWSIKWSFIGKDENKATPEKTAIAVIDHPQTIPSIAQGVIIIFVGKHKEKNSFFAVVETPSPDSVFTVIRRAYSYWEITEQNTASLYSEKHEKQALESIAETLSAHIHQLTRQSEMRIALVDQLPIGVLGIDDENTIVLANPKAIDVLAVEDIPIWGLSVSSLLTESVGKFIRDEEKKEIVINRYGQNIIIRKAPFMLNDEFAGTILVLWKPTEK
ncbi:MAG: hypothetical protein A2017_20700 [Lentisphaerae bacterium GWF2_44_16]|nr:MAG: hypothetical protein A2017_20700 [Lentisphaerae bacterium GWF2_44_16]